MGNTEYGMRPPGKGDSPCRPPRQPSLAEVAVVSSAINDSDGLPSTSMSYKGTGTSTYLEERIFLSIRIMYLAKNAPTGNTRNPRSPTPHGRVSKSPNPENSRRAWLAANDGRSP